MWKHVGIVVVVVAALVLAVVGAGCPKSTNTADEQPAAPATQAQPSEQPQPATPAAPAGEGKWLTSLTDGLAVAKADNKPVLVDFFATWCGPCKMMDEQTWPDANVKAAVAKYVPVRLDIDKNQDLGNQYNIEGVPTVVILDATGKEIDRKVGFTEPADLVKLLNKHTK